MDTSEQRIKMVDCEEIQAQKWVGVESGCLPLWEDGDILAVNGRIVIFNGCTWEHGHLGTEICGRTCVWLPTQSQLQEMVWFGFDGIARQHTLSGFHRFSQDTWNDRGVFTSMEQLWLAFVMKEKHNKTWNGEVWING